MAEKLSKVEKEKIRMKKPLRTAVHPTRLIAYLVQLAIVLYMYDFLRNFFMMIVVTIVAAAPVLDIIALIFVYRSVEVRILAPENRVLRKSVAYLEFELSNKSLMVSYDVCVKLDAENLLYKDESGTIISLPCSARNKYVKQLPVRYMMNGIYRYSIKTMTVRDLLGFVSLKKNADTSTEVYVYPEKDSQAEMNLSDMSRGMTESEETMKKGHDFSDVSDVREYIPGDKLMSIHWKLSAKRDILMVKDRVAMSDQQMVVLIDLAGNDEMVDEVVTLAYAVVDRFVREQTYVRLMWWSEGEFAFKEYQIMSHDDLNNAYSMMYYSNIYSDGQKIREYMRSIKPELKAYVNICMHNGKADAVVVEQD
ncbi:MAG: DUF58 domain-containing protein [Eubacterium sp.]|nr:DUF58 domain-containing protein [Eubacterium sp.]